jgi:glutathione-regulated potassium-efflux system ancillary protein KefG
METRNKAGDRDSILIYFAHPTPHKSRLNSAMLKSLEGLEDVTIRKLYDLYPDFYIDVKAEQKLLVEHDVIVWQHPLYWYSAPSLLKEWIDLVLEHGFAFGKEGNALQGKKVLTATTTGGSLDAYREEGRNHFTMNQLLAPFQQTVSLCKMHYLPPFVVHGSLLIDQDHIRKAAEDYRKIIISLRDKIFSSEDLKEQAYINNLLE